MNKQIFKVGDRVFDIRYGWGKVTICADTILYPIGVQFDEDDSQEVILYTEDGRGHLGDNKPVLSFTEYTLKGFSQKRVFDYSNCIGKYGKFYDNKHDIDKKDPVIAKLYSFSEKPIPKFCYRVYSKFIWYDNFEPFTEDEIKMLNLE